MTKQLSPLTITETYFTYHPSESEVPSLSSKEDIISNLLYQNAKLQEENTKYHNKLITLESSFKSKPSYVSQTNTSINFFLPSEIKNIWESLSIDIGDCFIDFFSKPTLTFHLLQELIFITQQMLKEKIEHIYNKVLSILDLENSEQIKKDLISSMKPFLQNYVIDIFDKESKRNKIFDNNICNHFVLFYNTEIFPLMNNSNDDEILHKNYTNDNTAINIYEIVNSKSFKRMISDIKRIILFTELNHQEISFNIDDYLSREISYDNSSYKDRNNFNVNGKCLENQSKIILLQPPVLKSGNPYPNLQKIVLPFDIIVKNDIIATQGISVRSTSYQNIYHYSEKEEEICKSQEDCDNTNKMNSPMNTDISNIEKIRTERLKLITKNENLILNNLIIKNHTRSLSKNSSTSDKKKGTIYKLKRKGKKIHLEELKNSKIFEFNSLINKKDNKKGKISVNDECVFRNNTNTNATINRLNYMKTNTICSKAPSKATHSKRISNSNLIESKKNKSNKNLLKKTNSNKSGCSVNKKKPKQIENKNIIEYKTNANTKIDVDELLSYKYKKNIDYRKTFIQTALHIDNM